MLPDTSQRRGRGRKKVSGTAFARRAGHMRKPRPAPPLEQAFLPRPLRKRQRARRRANCLRRRANTPLRCYAPGSARWRPRLSSCGPGLGRAGGAKALRRDLFPVLRETENRARRSPAASRGALPVSVGEPRDTEGSAHPATTSPVSSQLWSRILGDGPLRARVAATARLPGLSHQSTCHAASIPSPRAFSAHGASAPPDPPTRARAGSDRGMSQVGGVT